MSFASIDPSDDSLMERYAEYSSADVEAILAEAERPRGSRSATSFGGIEDSGYGRELGSSGIRELADIETVCLG